MSAVVDKPVAISLSPFRAQWLVFLHTSDRRRQEINSSGFCTSCLNNISATDKIRPNMSTVQRFFDHFDGSYFLFGPRGTGKSTWLRERFPDAAWIDLLNSTTMRRYAAKPDRLIHFIEAQREKGVVIIDEIQRVPALLSIVHQQMELDKSLRFILTGSSSRRLKAKGVDLLGGRAVKRQMHPFMAGELGDAFDLENALYMGLVPLVISSPSSKETLNGYIDLYIQEEVRAEGLVRSLDEFYSFLEAVSFSHGSVLNVASIARESSVSRNTVESYISILEDLLIAYRIPVFTRRAKRATVSHSKFYFFDAGVYRSLRPVGPIDSREEIHGPGLEGLVLQHLRGWIDYSGNALRSYYWRTQAGNEVDFVLYGNDGFYAFEVKNNVTVRPADLRGLRAFKTDYPEADCRLLYRGDEALQIDGILCQPVKEFLRALKPGPIIFR